MEWGNGIDIKAGQVRYNNMYINIASNIGPENYHPNGPQYLFVYVAINCLILCSERGGISMNSLIEFLKYFMRRKSSFVTLVVQSHFALLIVTILDWIENFCII